MKSSRRITSKFKYQVRERITKKKITCLGFHIITRETANYSNSNQGISMCAFVCLHVFQENFYRIPEKK